MGTKETLNFQTCQVIGFPYRENVNGISIKQAPNVNTLSKKIKLYG